MIWLYLNGPEPDNRMDSPPRLSSSNSQHPSTWVGGGEKKKWMTEFNHRLSRGTPSGLQPPSGFGFSHLRNSLCLYFPFPLPHCPPQFGGRLTGQMCHKQLKKKKKSFAPCAAPLLRDRRICLQLKREKSAVELSWREGLTTSVLFLFIPCSRNSDC